jgi:hypothetical protein
MNSTVRNQKLQKLGFKKFKDLKPDKTNNKREGYIKQSRAARPQTV